MSLCLTRKEREVIYIGSTKVEVRQVKGNRVRLAIEADKNVPIRRGELVAATEPPRG